MRDHPNTTQTTPAKAQQNLINRPDRYVHYAPAMRLGCSLAGLERYRDKQWAEVEPQARREWEEKYNRPWDEFAELVHQGWAQIRPQFIDDPALLEAPNGYEAAFRQHYQETFADDYSYKECASAYHLGYDLAVDRRLKQLDWDQVEAEVRHFWDKQGYARNWPEISEAVRYAWQMIRHQERASSFPR